MVCRTRDVSDVGVCLDTAAWLPIGTCVSLALTDPRAGMVIEVIGDVVREDNGKDPALGLLLIEPPADWRALVLSAARQSGTADKPGRRMRVLVIGDPHRQRGAAVSWIAVYQGYHADPTSEGVSRATTSTVVVSSLAILALDFILTAFMFH